MTSSSTAVPSGMNNRTSSLDVLPAVTVFDWTYSGDKETFTEGFYNSTNFNVINDNDISSLIAAPGVHVQLCSSAWGWGCQDFWGEMSLWGNSLNQQASAVRVQLGVTMYEDRDYQGPSEAFEPGTHVATTTSFTAIGNDAITSMIVAPDFCPTNRVHFSWMGGLPSPGSWQ